VKNGLTLALMDKTVQVYIITRKQIGRRRGRRGISSTLSLAVEQLCLCSSLSHTEHIAKIHRFNVGQGTRKRGKSVFSPILEPDLGLTLLHTQQFTNLSSSRRGRTPIHAEESLQMNELVRSYPRALSLLPFSTRAPTAAGVCQESTPIDIG
jgi:hypothetical protein